MPQPPVPSTFSIVAAGLPLYYELEAAVGSAILPGDLVQFSNPPTVCKALEGANDSESIIGVAEIHVGDTAMGGSDRTHAYSAGSQVVIFRGPCRAMLRIAASEEIQCGEFVQPAASGEVKAYVCGTDNDCQRIAQAMETVAQDTTTFQWGLFSLERFG